MRRLLFTPAALFFCISATAAAQTLERGYEDRTMRGPGTAQGAVIYSPGLVREGTPITATPYVVDDLQEAGWDVFRFVPPSAGDIVEVAAAALTEAVGELRGRSYKRIVLIGQSYGGWLSLAAGGAAGEPVDAVVALAPAAFGARGESENWTANASALAPLAEAVTARRVVVFLFRGDDYDPGGRAATLRDIFARRGLTAADVVDEPPGLVGHSAGLTHAFARRFGPCLRDVIDAADTPKSFACPEPGWAAMADFGVPADLATVAPPDAAAGAAPMAGRWYGVYDTGREVLFIVRRIDGDRAEAVYAFGPIIRGVDAPTGMTQRHGIVDPATGTVRFAEPEADTVIECRLQADGGLAFSLTRKAGGEPLHAVLRKLD